MKKTIKKYLALLILSNLFVNCASSGKIIYFQDSKDVQPKETVINYEPIIQIGDLISINIAAIDGITAIPFNSYETLLVENKNSNTRPISYLVDADGEINFPVIQKLKVAGLTTKQLNTHLKKLLIPYINNPNINIRITNFKITVLGQVRTPGTFNIPNERVSILEAIGMAGDLEIHGKRKNVMLIREQNGKREFINIDLTNKAFFDSPYFYLTQNDVLYIEPNKSHINSSAISTNTGVIYGSISLLATIVTLLLR